MSAPLTAEPAERLSAPLAEQIVQLNRTGVPSAVRDHAVTHLVNVVALAAAASRQPAVEAVLSVARIVGGPGKVPVPGRTDLLDPHHAALAAGLAAHHDDFDDTHLTTVIHPSAATFAALLPLAAEQAVAGQTLLDAFALGCESQLRIGVAMSPSHYDAGWHITGTCGVVGAAVAAGLLLDLDGSGLATAIGIACSMTVGQREGFGTALKPLHAGKAAANGLLAARLSQRGFTASTRALESPRGLFAVMAQESDPSTVLEGLGDRWEFLNDTVKPYPCGVVIHPLIDAALELRGRGVPADAVHTVQVTCHPLVVDLTGIRNPMTGLESKFSATHAVAAALEDGEVGLGTFSDRRVREPATIRLRERVELRPDTSIRRDQVRMRAVLVDGSEVTVDIAHGRGSLERPLTAEECAAKVHALMEPVRSGSGALLLEAGEKLLHGATMRDVVAATIPEEER